jgi:uncharacterized membrane protein YtjA (UPF0391 family)
MIQASIAFFILAILAYVFGAYNIAGVSLEIGKTFLLVFLILAIISFLYSMFTGSRLKL